MFPDRTTHGNAAGETGCTGSGPRVELFSDGACRGNPGLGGWGVILRCSGREKTLCGVEEETTNNRMELLAVIMGLEQLQKPCQVSLTTDSQYVSKGLSEWLAEWKAAGWRTRKKKPVKNEDLWQRLDSACTRHQVRCHWVRGHTGHVENERADALANEAIDRHLMARQEEA